MARTAVSATGLSGLVGSRLYQLAAGCFDWRPVGTDITDEGAVRSFLDGEGSRSIVHMAAFTDVSEAWKQRNDKAGECYRVNVLGTRYLARACSDLGKHLVYVSTDYVFDGGKDGVYTEDDEPGTADWYGLTKLWGEQEVRESGCRYAIVRLSFPFRSQHERKDDVVRRILQGLKNNSLSPMFTDAAITPTLIDDFCTAIMRILETGAQGTFHVVGSSHMSPYELARSVARVFGYDETRIQEGTLDAYHRTNGRPYPRYLRLSNKKLRTELGVGMSTVDEALSQLRKQMQHDP